MSMEINSTNSGVTSQIMDLKTSTPGVTRKEEIKTGFKNTNDYSKYLQEKYSYMNTGKTSMQGVPVTVRVSGAFLKKCMDNPEKAAYLEENLAAIPECIKRSVEYTKTMKEMQAAVEKGCKQATGAWGRELPSICKDTFDATNKLFDDYYASKEEQTE